MTRLLSKTRQLIKITTLEGVHSYGIRRFDWSVLQGQLGYIKNGLYQYTLDNLHSFGINSFWLYACNRWIICSDPQVANGREGHTNIFNILDELSPRISKIKFIMPYFICYRLYIVYRFHLFTSWRILYLYTRRACDGNYSICDYIIIYFPSLRTL